ncbi:hypothetical protein AA0119_g12858 [Alternaria tenuissima]|uniref:NACHT domain-containing protein n=1 Tax=Alternaria tenuissima TaxID=119927 RepID=A0A4Q4NY27_9PLEO|nr:hypothetical protein AA0115_g10836 [Alternaria tenuissima]RYN86474.1 hypothetical protein AA0119_g12858 [Alternaria tenuissima]RYO07627.1 hypothetical protein AA0121_g11711 [Alternaria tenuissima]RYO66099.1 hypothetical protein AA0116_g2885 [Alternaria tenuissima]
MAAPSAQARVTLQNAFERFASTVAPDDKRLFYNTKLKDVRDEVMQIEGQLRARRMQRNMARLDPFLRGMEHYSKVVEVLCNGTPYLSWIWAPVKLMLMITIDSIDAFEKLIEAYARIGNMLPRLDRLGHALADDHNFQNVLALVYSDIIEFHRRAYKFVRQRSWAVFFGSMWLGFESRFNEISKSLAYHSDLADKEAAAADIAEAIRRSKADDERWERQENEWNAAKVQKVLAWLGTSDTSPADLFERHIHNCLPGSCDWFIKHNATQLWLGDSTKNPFLWLCGKPGAGKSIISSALVQHAQTNGFHVFYYFCNSFASHTDGPGRLLRAITSQVIQKHQSLAIYVHDVYFKSHPVPTEKTMLTLLSELFRGLGSVRLVVDGLDEWDPKYQKGLLKDLSQMVSTDQNSHVCKIMIASRDTMDISRSFRKKDKLGMTVSLSDGDEDLAISHSIANFVEDKLSDLPDHFDELDPDTSIVTHVKKTLLEKSHGMFLWVSLVLESLDTVYSPEELRTIVDDLPSDLEALYEQILTRLCSAPGAKSYGGVSRVISWICFTRRPLHKSELLQALSIFPDDMGSQVRSVPIASILDHCKPLIEELSDSTIVPVHFSVKEYFLKSQTPHIVPELDAVLDISSACVIIIMRGLDLVFLDSGSIDCLARIASGNYRLLPYAIEFWIEHCSQYYASGGGSLGLDRPLQHHMARMYEKHQDYLHTLGRAISQVKTQETAHASDVDGRLEPFSNMPIYGLMADVLHLRRLASQLDGDNSSNIETYVMDNDRTLFSLLAHKYESAIVHLLAQHEIAGIAPMTLRAFQQSYVSTAFRCRFPHCDRLSLGFATVELRLEHEAVHIRRVYCQTESCHYSRTGFAKRSALNGHTRKYHGQSNILPIPAKMRRTTNTGAGVETKSPDSQTIDTRPRQENPVSQPVANGQQLLRADDVLKLQCLLEDEKQKYRMIMQNFWTIFNNNPQGSQENTNARQKLTEWSQKFIGRERQYRARMKQQQQKDKSEAMQKQLEEGREQNSSGHT